MLAVSVTARIDRRPLGNVKFTDSTNGAVLGTVKPGLQCILRRGPCIVTSRLSLSPSPSSQSGRLPS